MRDFTHKPVLFDEVIAHLNIRPDGLYADLTLGRAGHAEGIVQRLQTGRLIGFDRDGAAIEAAAERLAPYGERALLVRSDFRNIKAQLGQLQISDLDGILMDLGVSSPQLDDATRGFSYMQDAPLDMRMDTDARLTAAQIVNEWAVEDLRRILFEYGEEKFSARIAGEIVRARPVRTTFELVEAIRRGMPAKALHEKQHPAKRTFQAIRIAVNDELNALSEALADAETLLRVGGRLAVITFHSLEDRIVKNFFQDKSGGCICPRNFPVCVCGQTPSIKILTRKPIVPSDLEIEENPRARSAKLRIAERIK